MKGRTKLKFTVASFIVHCMILISFTINKQYEPILWGTWFASFNTTLAVYATSKTYKDKIIIQEGERNGNANIH